MKRNVLVIGYFSFAFTMSIASVSLGNVTNFSATVFGTQKNPINCDAPPAPCEILLSGSAGEEVTYGNFKIKGWTDNQGVMHPAKIIAVEGDNDSLSIIYAVITGTVAASGSCTSTNTGLESCPYINASATFASPPSTDGGDVTFVRTISGTFQRGANPAQNSAVKAHGVADQITVGQDGRKVISTDSQLYSGAAPTQIFDTSQIWYQGGSPALSDPRAVSEKLWVYVKQAGDVLTISEYKTWNPPGGGVGKPDCAANKKKGKKLKLCARN